MSFTDVRLRCLASPARARSLFTVRAAISSAVSSDRPRSRKPSLMCLYWRSRFLFHACCGTAITPHACRASTAGSVVEPSRVEYPVAEGGKRCGQHLPDDVEALRSAQV